MAEIQSDDMQMDVKEENIKEDKSLLPAVRKLPANFIPVYQYLKNGKEMLSNYGNGKVENASKYMEYLIRGLDLSIINMREHPQTKVMFEATKNLILDVLSYLNEKYGNKEKLKEVLLKDTLPLTLNVIEKEIKKNFSLGMFPWSSLILTTILSVISLTLQQDYWAVISSYPFINMESRFVLKFQFLRQKQNEVKKSPKSKL